MKKVAGIELYTLEEIGEAIGVTIESMRMYVRKGRLGAQKIGGKYYTTQDAVRRFVENREDCIRADLTPGNIELERAVRLRVDELYEQETRKIRRKTPETVKKAVRKVSQRKKRK